ncbi:hypothetical protein ABTX62_31500 [Streptomyces sp. NPDC096046]|uniref:hypothetical protein n=1 Tax=Streptomyces sp. NPDC096046 TaxID=3155542 RepID=UPI003331F399
MERCGPVRIRRSTVALNDVGVPDLLCPAHEAVAHGHGAPAFEGALAQWSPGAAGTTALGWRP